MITGVDHIAIAVENLEEAAAAFSKLVGCPPSDIKIETVPSEKVRVAFLSIGQTKIELLEPTDQESTVAKFLQKTGGGLHHIALATDDITTEASRVYESGLDTLGAIRDGAGGKRIIFIHPKQTARALVELCQKPQH